MTRAPWRRAGGWIERFYTKLEATLYPGLTSPVERNRYGIRTGVGAEPDPDTIRDYWREAYRETPERGGGHAPVEKMVEGSVTRSARPETPGSC